jgi:hypothetical protein
MRNAAGAAAVPGHWMNGICTRQDIASICAVKMELNWDPLDGAGPSAGIHAGRLSTGLLVLR